MLQYEVVVRGGVGDMLLAAVPGLRVPDPPQIRLNAPDPPTVRRILQRLGDVGVVEVTLVAAGTDEELDAALLGDSPPGHVS